MSDPEDVGSENEKTTGDKTPVVHQVHIQAEARAIPQVKVSKLAGVLRLGKGLDSPLASYDLARLPPGSEPVPEPTSLEKLIKLFPAEGVVLLPLALGIAGNDQGLTLLLLAVIVLLIVRVRYVATRAPEGGPPDWRAIIISVISFLLFANSFKAFGEYIDPPAKQTLLASFVTIVWLTLVSRNPTKPG